MSCQIAFIFGEQIAAFLLEKKQTNPFKTLLDFVFKEMHFGDREVNEEEVYFVYEDDEGDRVKIDSDADLLEAIAVNEDGGSDELLLNVCVVSQVRTSEEVCIPTVIASKDGIKANSEDDSDSDAGNVREEKKRDEAGLTNPALDENFVLEVSNFLSDPAVKQTLPEIAAFIAGQVSKRTPALAIYDGVVTKFPFLLNTNLFRTFWPFIAVWSTGYDTWTESLTDDQLGKVAFQIPVIALRLSIKRAKLHYLIFTKKKDLSKIVKIKHFDFGAADIGLAFARANSGNSVPSGHIGTTCAGCFTSPIQGVRFKCMVCPDVNFCEPCESLNAHPQDHALMKFKTVSAGYLGLSNATCMDKKVQKHHLRSLKMEAKLAKRDAKIAARVPKEPKSPKKEKKGMPMKPLHEMSKLEAKLHKKLLKHGVHDPMMLPPHLRRSPEVRLATPINGVYGPDPQAKRQVGNEEAFGQLSAPSYEYGSAKRPY